MHLTTIEGYITEIGTDRFIVHAFNIVQLKNVIRVYNLDYVPFIGKDCIKVKQGDIGRLAKIQGITLKQRLEGYLNHNLKIEVMLRKNTVKGSTSLSAIAKKIVMLDPLITTVTDVLSVELHDVYGDTTDSICE